MPLATCLVTGFVNMPNGTPASGFIKFALSEFDADPSAIVLPAVTVSPIQNGQVSVALWPNSRGMRATRYQIYVSPDSHEHISFGDVFLGQRAIPDAPSVTLEEVLRFPGLPSVADTVVLSMEEYLALENPDERTLYLIAS